MLRLSGTVPVLQLANNLYSLLVTFTCGICIFKLNSSYMLKCYYRHSVDSKKFIILGKYELWTGLLEWTTGLVYDYWFLVVFFNTFVLSSTHF